MEEKGCRQLRGKRILVTGSEGFIGGQLCQALRRAGHSFEVYDAKYVEPSNLALSTHNLLQNFCPSIIFHVGANSNTLDNDVTEVMVRNFIGTDIISSWASENGANLIYSSSAASYGIHGEFPSNLYGWSKFTAERLVVERNGIALRYFNVYGPGEQEKGAMASFAYQAHVKHTSQEVVRLFPGAPTRDFVHVSDVVSANFFAAMNFNELKGRWFDVGTGLSSSFESVLTLLGISWEYHSESEVPEGYQRFTLARPEKFMPGWTPTVTLKQGLLDYKNYLEEVSF